MHRNTVLAYLALNNLKIYAQEDKNKVALRLLETPTPPLGTRGTEFSIKFTKNYSLVPTSKRWQTRHD